MEGLSVIEQWFKVLSEESAQPLLTAFLQRFTRVQIRFFIIVLQQMVRADPMTALLSPAVGGSMQSQMEAKLANSKSTMPGFPSPRTFNTSATNRQSLAFDSSSSFLSPNTANTVGNPSDAAASLAQQRATLSRWQPHIIIPSAEYRLSGLSAGSAFRSPLPDGGGLDRLSPKMSSNNNNGQTVDLAVAKLSDLYGSSNVPRLDGPDKFHRPSRAIVYGDSNDCDFIQGHHAPGVGRVQTERHEPVQHEYAELYTPNFEVMTWKVMVVMDEQALEAQGVTALGARRKILKTFEVVRKKMGIDDPTAPPPPPALSSGGPAPGAPGSISGGSAGSGGGLSA
ncbi:hypothetical protein EDB85DRAFT_2159186 [Lactarius pseudohatsudake]|nr:hypothetical protein EDB85DRAFT_2159186 [Lactarius pseudohatsudake]